MQPLSNSVNSNPYKPPEKPSYTSMEEMVEKYARIARESLEETEQYKNEMLAMHHENKTLISEMQVQADLLMQSCDMIQKMRREQGTGGQRTTPADIARKASEVAAAIFFFFSDLLLDAAAWILEITCRTLVYINSSLFNKLSDSNSTYSSVSTHSVSSA